MTIFHKPTEAIQVQSLRRMRQLCLLIEISPKTFRQKTFTSYRNPTDNFSFLKKYNLLLYLYFFPIEEVSPGC